MSDCIYIDESFKEKERLFHFTTFNNFEKIIESGVLFMSPLSSNLNDKKEESYLSNYLRGKAFITCFTSEMNEKFWTSCDYAKGVSDGVCICFNVEKLLSIKVKTATNVYLDLMDRMVLDYDLFKNENDYRIRNLVFKKVIYKDDPTKDFVFDKDTYNFFVGCCNVDELDLINYCKTVSNMGFVKTKIDVNGNDQSYENEYRILARILHKGSEVKWQMDNKTFPENMFKRLHIDIKPIINSLAIIVKKEFTHLDKLKDLSEQYNFTYKII